MIRLTTEQVLKMHSQLIRETGGTDGIRDQGILESALNSPFQSFAGDDIYPSLQHKAARLCFGIVKNHYTQKELTDTILALAAGDIGSDDLFQWVTQHQL